MDISLGSEADGSVIRRLREAPALANENHLQKYSRFELLMETGVGLTTGQGSNPLVMMEYSDDYGHTWSDIRTETAGAIGEYRKRVYWDRCGVGRGRIFRVSVSDPVPFRIIDAFINNRPGQQQAA